MSSPILNSWKEIAQYLGRGIKTVQRWEKDLGLPVRRPHQHLHSAVIAIPSEIDEWLLSDRHIGPGNCRNGGNSPAATRRELRARSRNIQQLICQLHQTVSRLLTMVIRSQSGDQGLVHKADISEGSRMALDTKSLEQLQQLAQNLRRQIRLHPQHSKLEEVELREVEGWIALRRKDGEEARAAAA